MAARDERPKAHLIEAAKSKRSNCQTCGKPIAMGELRLAEAFVTDEGRWAKAHHYARSARPREYDSDDRGYNHDSVNPDVIARFHHLPCAASHQPYKLRSALAASTLDIPDRAALEAAIERGLSAVDAAEDDEANREVYQRFLADLRDAPDDEALLVFGDWLQGVGDPRGELIATQHALETAAADERARLGDLEKKLIATNRKRFLLDRLDGKLVWRRGFVHRLVVPSTGLDPGSLARAFEHPSFRLVRELSVERDAWAPRIVAPNLPTPLPPTLRTLELAGAQLGDVAAVLAGTLPQLQRLRLSGATELVGLAHPTLSQLELDCADATAPVATVINGGERTLVERLGELRRRNLPGLTALVLRVERGLDDALAAVIRTDLFAGVRQLTLFGDVSHEGVASLVQAALHFATIDVRRCHRIGNRELATLGTLADQVLRDEAAPAAAPEPAPIREWLVRHTRRPEWGTGKVVAETEQGLEVAFEHGGTKLVRNIELLEELRG